MITVAIVFFNDRLFLREAILSVFGQSFEDWKLVLVDDGSKDGSFEIANEFTSDSRVTLFRDGSNSGLATRLNFIAKICNTEYLARMDADDVMAKNRLEVQFGFLSRNPTIDVLGSAAYVIDGEGFVKGIRGSSVEGNIKRASTLIHPTIMARTSWFLKHPYDESFKNRCQDLELWFRVRRGSNLFYVTQPLLFYREVEADYKRKYKSGLREMRIFWSIYKGSMQANYIFIKYVFVTLLYITGFSKFLLYIRNTTNFRKKLHYSLYMSALFCFTMLFVLV